MGEQRGDVNPTRFRRAGTLTAIMLAALWVSSAEAASVPLTNGPDAGTFTLGSNERRQTHFEALNSVTLTALGADIDPSSSSATFEWKIFDSNASRTFGSELFASGSITYTDVGQAVYDLAVSVSLNAGSFYILELRSTSVGSRMRRYDESVQGLPFTTSDGNFEVTGGAVGTNFNNPILPAFSVTLNPEPIPGLTSQGTWVLVGCLLLAALGTITLSSRPI